MRATRKPRDLEHQEQVALFNWARLAGGKHPELQLLFAVPNGGHRHPAVAAKLRAEGVRAGVPDICLPVPRGDRHGLWIELKTATGRASPEQRQWIADLRAQGYRAEVCRGWEAAKELLMEYLAGDLYRATCSA